MNEHETWRLQFEEERNNFVVDVDYLSLPHDLVDPINDEFITHCLSCNNQACLIESHGNNMCWYNQMELRHYRACVDTRCTICAIIRYAQMIRVNSRDFDDIKEFDTALKFLIRNEYTVLNGFLDENYKQWVLYMRQNNPGLNTLFRVQVKRCPHHMIRLNWVMRLLCDFLPIKI